MTVNDLPLVNIVMPTYNHDKYISQAIESVLMQQCSFNYQLIISEDFSTDNTLLICEHYQKNYPEKIILLKNEINIGLIRNYKKIFDACNAKYLAILESDDYWIDPLKLQKQINILESDDSIGLVHTRSATIYENGEIKVDYRKRQSDINYEELYIKIMKNEYGVGPLTVCFKRELLQKIDFDFCLNNNLKTIDFLLWPEFARNSKFYFINNITAHYRYLNTSESNSKNILKIKSFLESSTKIKLHYFNKYPIAGLSEKKILEDINYSLAIEFINNLDFENALCYCKKLPHKKIKYLWISLISRYRFLHPLYLLHDKSLKYLSNFKQFIFSPIKFGS